MFAKKLLSIISLLFVGSQIASVAADCSIDLTLSEKTVTGCELATGDDVSCNAGFYAVYQSDPSGYQLNDDKNILDSTGGTLVEIDSKGACAIVEDNGYYRSTTDNGSTYTYISLTTAEGVTLLPNDKKCSESGKIDTSGKLCIGSKDDAVIEFGKNEGYLVTDANKLFGNDASAKVVIKSNANSIKAVELAAGSTYLVNVDGTLKSIDSAKADATVTDGIDYCVDDGLAIWERKEGLCKASSDCTYYTFDDSADPKWTKTEANTKRVNGEGECTPKTDKGTCEAGYHYVSGDKELYLCDHETGCFQQTIPLGYIKTYDGSYITCSVDGEGKSCTDYTEVVEASDCSAPGALYVTEAKKGDYTLCLSNGKAVVLSGVSEKTQYMVDYKANTFGITAKQADYSIVMEIDGGNVTVVKDSTRYRYTDSKGTDAALYQVYDREQAQKAKGANAICGTGGAPYEYMLVQWDVSDKVVYEKGKESVVDFYVAGDNDDLKKD